MCVLNTLQNCSVLKLALKLLLGYLWRFFPPQYHDCNQSEINIDVMTCKVKYSSSTCSLLSDGIALWWIQLNVPGFWKPDAWPCLARRCIYCVVCYVLYVLLGFCISVQCFILSAYTTNACVKLRVDVIRLMYTLYCVVFFRLENKNFKLMLQKAVKKISAVRQVAQVNLADEDNILIHHHWQPCDFALSTSALDTGTSCSYLMKPRSLFVYFSLWFSLGLVKVV